MKVLQKMVLWVLCFTFMSTSVLFWTVFWQAMDRMIGIYHLFYVILVGVVLVGLAIFPVYLLVLTITTERNH